MIEKQSLSETIELVEVKNVDNEDRVKLFNEYDINNEIINYATDKRERARLEYNDYLNLWMVVFQVISNKLSTYTKITTPVTFVIKDETIIVFTTDKTHFIVDYFRRSRKKSDYSSWSYLFSVIKMVSEDYINEEQDIEDKRETTQDALGKKEITNKDIASLSRLQEKNTYIITASNNNSSLLKEIDLASEKESVSINLKNVEKELLGDAEIEFNQINKTASLTGDFIDKLSNSYNNILNNQTNSIMQVLTIYSIILAVPTIISGFYGMNMFLPVADKSWSWLFALGLTILLIIIILMDLKRRHFL